MQKAALSNRMAAIECILYHQVAAMKEFSIHHKMGHQGQLHLRKGHTLQQHAVTASWSASHQQVAGCVWFKNMAVPPAAWVGGVYPLYLLECIF
jgi:hypothetical protein